MEFIQDLLTVTTQIIAIAGFTGIVAHAMWKHHCSWMATYCPPVKPFESATQVEASEPEAICLQQRNALAEVLEQVEDIAAPVEPVAELQPISEQPAIADPWGLPITTSSRRWASRQQPQPSLYLLPPAKEQPKSATPTRKPATKRPQQALEINLNSLDSAALRKLCSKHGISWRNARGQGKHLTKAAMVFQLEQKAIA